MYRVRWGIGSDGGRVNQPIGQKQNDTLASGFPVASDGPGSSKGPRPANGSDSPNSPGHPSSPGHPNGTEPSNSPERPNRQRAARTGTNDRSGGEPVPKSRGQILATDAR